MVTINTISLQLSKSQMNSPEWRLTKKISDLDLAGYKKYLEYLIKSMPVKFLTDIELTVSVKKSDLTFKIDYSKIKINRQVRLLKSYLSGNKKEFAEEWLRLGLSN
jgi:hypothetical protein